MTGRSRTGCLTCRQRKLKCDEQRPVCGQCQKGSRNCIPANPIVFRHQQNASMNSDGSESSLKDFYRYKNSFDKNHIWVPVPKRISFVINEDPYADGDLDVEETHAEDRPESNGRTGVHAVVSATHDVEDADRRPVGLEALSIAANADRYDQLPPIHVKAGPDDHGTTLNTGSATISVHAVPSRSPITSPPSSGLPASHNLNFILNPTSNPSGSAFSPPIDPVLDRSASILQSTTSDADAETDRETAFLLRYFSECPGQWMDLYDLGGFFAYYIPVKAIANPLLKHAAAAYAAKQLSRVKGKKSYMGGLCSTPAGMEQASRFYNVDWENRGLEHYDKAIELLKQAMHDNSNESNATQQAFADPESTWSPGMPYLDAAGFGSTEKRPRSIQRQDVPSPHTLRTSSTTPSAASHDRHKRRKISTGKTSSDEMAAATAILCVFEFLDGSNMGWKIQLDGTKSLLDIAETTMVPLAKPHITPRPQLSKARRATFWNFARQDFLSALITETQTRLDPEDVPMWRDAGILIDEDGFVRPSNTTVSGYPEGEDIMKEDMISNALIWILAKIVNYCVAADTAPSQLGGVPRPWEGINQVTLHHKWLELQKQLTVWYEGLPDTFKPCAEVAPKEDEVFPEIWFSLPMCASTMQWYHYAQMLLLIPSPLLQNQPQQSTIGKTTFHKRFGSYKSIAAEIEYHACMICSIACSRPEASVRIHMIQPLYLAGQCFEGRAERLEVVRLLREVQTDTGWVSEWRVTDLLQLWGWTGVDLAAGAA